MRVEWDSGRLRVFDGDDVVCRIDVDDWADCADSPAIDRPVAANVSGWASRIRLPPGRVVCQADGKNPSETGQESTDVRGPIRVDGPVSVVLAFRGTATIHDRSCGVDVSFATPRPVTIGTNPGGHEQRRRLTVPGTPEGVAAALTHASNAPSTTSPMRSDPATRRPPPLIEPGDSIEIPDVLRSGRTGIDLVVPPDLESLFVLAPLAYYLGARVTVESREAPLLRAPDVGVRHELSSLPELQADAAALLYRCVILDCLLREAGNEPAPDSYRRLAAVGVDPDRIGDRGIDERLAAFLEAPLGNIDSELPEWHLSVYATPAPEHLPTLGYVLDRLAFVYLPDASRLPEAERLQRSLADFYRGPADAATVDPILPDLNRGRLHGWLGDGVAIDAFSVLPESYANRRSRPATDGPTDVTLVVNDVEMDAEPSAVRRIYQAEPNSSGIDVRVERRLDRDALADALRRPTDLLHFVGHCDRSGFRCVDGHLDATGIEHCGADVFFLNACGSYHQGVSLVEAGSVAGAVTLRPVLDGQAKRVGTAFARLLMRGFAIERALRIASRRAIMNKDYAVVGDGTYTLHGPGAPGRAVTRIRRSGEQFEVEVEHGTAEATAVCRQSALEDGVCLSGTRCRASMSRDELCAFLQEQPCPTVYEGQYYWAPDLRRVLHQGTAGE
jgi:hypothetical protein